MKPKRSKPKHPPKILELSMVNPRLDLVDERSGKVVRLPSEMSGSNLLINLTKMTLDSWGIALSIVAMQQITSRGGNVALFGIREDVRRVFESIQLDKVFRIFPTREEALAHQGLFPWPVNATCRK